MKPLTPEQQIEVLENIDWKDLIRYKDGLCYGIMISLRDTAHISVLSSKFGELIPLFTRQNALKFEGHPHKAYWWDCSIDSYNNRKCFVDWIIEELEKQLQNEKYHIR